MGDVHGAAGTEGRRMCGGVPERARLHMAMLALQFGYAGFHVVSRLALNMGVSKLVFPVYRNLIALCLLAPFAYFLEKKDRPAMTLSFLVQLFLLALCGITASQGFYLLGLDNTSPTFASVITLFKGPAIFGPATNNNLQLSAAASVGDDEGKLSGKSWTLGCVYLIGHCLSWSGWLVLQAPVLKKYPARLSVTSYTCFFGLLQFLAIAAFVERDSSAWTVSSGSELFTILYAGFVASGMAFAVQTWCIDRSGPVFVAVYQPVQTLVVAVMASLALGEQFYLGGIIGAVLIIAGLYLVLWGKSEERELAAKEAAAAAICDQPAAADSCKLGSSLKQPLLPPLPPPPASENV